MKKSKSSKSTEKNNQITTECIELIFDPDRDVYYSIAKNIDLNTYYSLHVTGHAEAGNLDVLQWMSKNPHYSLQSTNESGEDILMIAARRGYEKLVKWLLKNDFDISKRDNHGKTAEQIAFECGHTGIAKMIRSRFEKNTHNTSRFTLFYQSIREEVCKLGTSFKENIFNAKP